MTRRFKLTKCTITQAINYVVLNVAVFLFLSCNLASGQSDDSGSIGQSAGTESNVTELQNNFDNAIEELRTAVKTIKRTGAKFYQSRSTEAYEFRDQWEGEAVVAEAAFKRVQESAIALFFALKAPDAELIQIVKGINQKLVDKGQLTDCFAVTKKLLLFYPNDPDLTKLMGRVSIMTNDFESALSYYETNKSEAESFGLPEQMLYGSVDKLGPDFERELQFRESDAQGEALPHAVLKTNKGTIVIELFENQAPETVANFVSLAKAGFYDEVIFHHVLNNMIAESGGMTISQPKPIDYTIHDESQKPDARHHFRGSVSMVLNDNQPNSGGSLFRIMRVPNPFLNGKSTVFGRVISGMGVVDSIENTFTINEEEANEEVIMGAIPDTIESVTLKQLQEHEYEPNRVKK